MKELNYKTKKASDYLIRYFKSYVDNIVEAYKTKPSLTKIDIEKDIKDEMEKNDGRRYRIIGAGQSYFSCGYLIGDGDDCYLIVLTPAHEYKIKYDTNYIIELSHKWNKEHGLYE